MLWSKQALTKEKFPWAIRKNNGADFPGVTRHVYSMFKSCKAMQVFPEKHVGIAGQFLVSQEFTVTRLYRVIKGELVKNTCSAGPSCLTGRPCSGPLRQFSEEAELEFHGHRDGEQFRTLALSLAASTHTVVHIHP